MVNFKTRPQHRRPFFPSAKHPYLMIKSGWALQLVVCIFHFLSAHLQIGYRRLHQMLFPELKQCCNHRAFHCPLQAILSHQPSHFLSQIATFCVRSWWKNIPCENCPESSYRKPVTDKTDFFDLHNGLPKVGRASKRFCCQSEGIGC